MTQERYDKPTDAQLHAALAEMAGKRIFFGHQSVGFDILKGVEELSARLGVPAPLIAQNKIPSGEAGLFHAPVGENTKPLTKMDEFARILRSGGAANVDYAMLKLCYVDSYNLKDANEAETLFLEYKKTMSELKSEFPHVSFIHMTMPLTSMPQGFSAFKANAKAAIKGLFGSVDSSQNENSIREYYNRLIREEYEQTGTVFDIALYESLSPNGRRQRYIDGDKKSYYALEPAFTHDGGHLNELGRRQVAEQLVMLLGR